MLFNTFDTARSGVIGFEEFMEGLALYTKSTERHQKELIFNLYDLNNDGCVTEAELATMMFSTFAETMDGQIEDKSIDPHSQVENYAHRIMKKFGKTVRSQMNLVEFCAFLKAYPKIQMSFEKCFHKELWSAQHYPEVPSESSKSGGCCSGKSHKPRNSEPSTPGKGSSGEMSGWLTKLEGVESERKWVVLRSNLLLFYEDEGDAMPDAVIFMEGCYIEKLPQKLELSIVHHFHEFSEVKVRADNAQGLETWYNSLEKACNRRHFEEFFMITEEVIGTGKFSKVYLGYDLKNEDRWAIKLINKCKLNETELELLRCEIAIMRLLHHPNVVSMKDIFDTKTHLYIVMELVEGGELFEKIASEKHLSEFVSSSITQQLLDIVAYLHRAGIVHRDIKPENIMLVSREEQVPHIKLVDFGMSKLISPTEKAMVPCGTLDYAAPELLSCKGYNKEVDMWSIGVVTYLMLTGTLPFTDQDNNKAIKKIMEAHIDFNAAIWEAFTPQCKDFLSHLLTKDLNNRLSAEDALEHPWITHRHALSSQLEINESRRSESVLLTNIQMSSALLRSNMSRSVMASMPDLSALMQGEAKADTKLEVRLRKKR
jgi:calcium/calmodulin-dependent protein kinase I